MHALGEALPDRLIELGAGAFGHGLPDVVLEVLLGPFAAAETDEGEAGGQQTTVGEVVDGGQEFPAGEVAGDAENHHARRASDAR